MDVATFMAGNFDARNAGWNDTRIAVLKVLWADGLSASQIATEIGGGLSRNAVIGKIHRLKLPQRRTFKKVANGSDVMMGVSPRKRTRNTGTPTPQRRNPLKPQAPELAIEEFPVDDVHGDHPNRKTLLELGNEHCRYPYGEPRNAEFHFCGNAGADFKAGISYCKGHHRLTSNGVPNPNRAVKARLWLVSAV